jgi:hypothetical protein
VARWEISRSEDPKQQAMSFAMAGCWMSPRQCTTDLPGMFWSVHQGVEDDG